MYNSRVIGFDTAPHHERMLALQADDVYIKRSIPLWVRTFDLRTFLAQHRANGGDSHLTRAVVAAGGQILRGRARTSRVKRRPRVMETPTARSITIARASSFDERATELWLRVEPEFDLAMRRFADFLNWRYLDPRAGRISVFTAAEGDRLLGFAAFRTSGPEARVLDLVTDPTAPAVGRELLVQGAAAARQAGCRYLVCLLPKITVTNVLSGTPVFSRQAPPTPSTWHAIAMPPMCPYSTRSFSTPPPASTSPSATSITDSALAARVLDAGPSRSGTEGIGADPHRAHRPAHDCKIVWLGLGVGCYRSMATDWISPPI